MSSAAITLQCPSCGGVFLTLQQNSGGMEICPHCAAASPRGSYRRMEGEAAFPRTRTVLPARRATPVAFPTQPPQETDPMPSPVPTEPQPVFAAPSVATPQTPPPQPVFTAPLVAAPPTPPPQPALAAPPVAPPLTPTPQPWQSPFAPAPVITPPTFQPSILPPSEIAPESPAPPASSPPASAFFRSSTAASSFAPSIDPATLPPPQIGFTPPPAGPVPTPASTDVPASIPSFLPSLDPAALQTSQPAAEPPPFQAASAPASPPPPIWPGLGVEENPEPIEPVTPPAALAPSAPQDESQLKTVDTASPEGPVSAQAPPDHTTPAPAQPRRSSWVSVLLFLSLSAGLGLTMWKFSRPRTFPVQAQSGPSTPASISTPPVSLPPSPSISTPPPSQSTPTPSGDPPSAALLPTGEAAAKLEAAQQLMQSLDSAKSVDERLKWIANGDAHRDSVTAFFAANASGLRATVKDPDVGFFIDVATKAEVKLYIATTATCPDGAMVRLVPDGGKDLLDWPLFAQTHQLEFDHFTSAGGELPPRWFYLLCGRARASDLVGAAQEAHHALAVQGSLSATGEARLYVKKSSPAGKLIESRMAWGRFYFIHALVERTTIDGKKVLLMQDCTGTGSPPK